jgi:hypothetical protein
MSRSKYGHSTLSGLIDSDSDDTQFVKAVPTPDSAAENRVPARKARGKPKNAPTKVTKQTKVRRLSGRLMAKAKTANPAPSKTERKALADMTNHQLADETEEVDEFQQNEDTDMGDELDATIIAVKENKPQPTKKKGPAGPGVTKKRVPTKCAASIERSLVVLESQVPEMEVENTREEEDHEKRSFKKVHTNHPREPSRRKCI